MSIQRVPHRLLLGKPKRVVQGAEKQRLQHRPVPFCLHSKHHFMPLGFLQDQMRHVEQRIGPAGHPDLPGQRIHPVFFRDE
jgi:hypothetical protein